MATKKDPKPDELKVVDRKRAMETLDKIRKRDAELLRRLAK